MKSTIDLKFYSSIQSVFFVVLMFSGCSFPNMRETYSERTHAASSPTEVSQPEHSQDENASSHKVKYDAYGKPLATTRGQFTVVKSVNLRAKADSSSMVLGVLPAGATVTVNKTVHGYYEISYKGKTGYSWHKFLVPK